MWTRQELKARGKAAFKRNYWWCVGAGAVVLVLTGATVGSGSRVSGGAGEIKTQLDAVTAQTNISVGALIGILIGLIGVGILVSTGVSLFLRNPILVGTDRFFLKNTQESPTLKELSYPFKNGRYLKIVAVKLLANLFVVLWSLLLIIPGIIKAYEYAMVGYILADDPDMGYMDALRQSKQMMAGHKWNTFVLELSFLGWEILSVFTFGLLDVFYVRPYMEATFAELYLELKQ